MTKSSLLLGAGLAAGIAMSAPAPATAQEIFTTIFSAIGIMPNESPPIQYRERPPLVVPPKAELRQPQPRVEQRNPAWPNDPDVAARRQEAAERNAPVIRPGIAENPTMSPRELRGGPRTASNRYSGRPLGDRSDLDNNELMIGPARQMRAADTQREQSLRNLTPGEEPERKALSEPPTGYRKPTELVRAPAEPVKEIDSSSTRDFVMQQRRN